MTMDAKTEKWIRIASVSEIPRGEGRIFHVGTRVIALFHLENGVICAVDNACPHRGGPLAHGILTGETVICPLHGWKIDLMTGKVLGESEGVKTYPVLIDHDGVLIAE